MAATKPWRLSASVVVLAPRSSLTVSAGGHAARAAVAPAGAGASTSRRTDYKICFLKRHSQASFMPDQMVFPGGALDAADRASAAALLGSGINGSGRTVHLREGEAPPEAVIRTAACREAFEEAGLPLVAPQPSVEAWARACAEWRSRVHRDASEFVPFCHELDVRPAASELLPWCTFITPDSEHSRIKKGGFDTRFYVWCAPEAAPLRAASADASETVRLVWLDPDEALDAVANGELSMAPRQWYVVHELATHCRSLSAVTEYAASLARSIRRDYPMKPHPIAPSASDSAAFLDRHPLARAAAGEPETTVFALAFPGDNAHPQYRGPPGKRHRLLIAGSLRGVFRAYELQIDDFTAHLPLAASSEPWHALAKI